MVKICITIGYYREKKNRISEVTISWLIIAELLFWYSELFVRMILSYTFCIANKYSAIFKLIYSTCQLIENNLFFTKIRHPKKSFKMFKCNLLDSSFNYQIWSTLCPFHINLHVMGHAWEKIRIFLFPNITIQSSKMWAVMKKWNEKIHAIAVDCTIDVITYKHSAKNLESFDVRCLIIHSRTIYGKRNEMYSIFQCENDTELDSIENVL